MIGTTLGDIREYIESLAVEDGQYYLVCGRTGHRPVPAHGLSFASRVSARAAARATEQYRAVLGQYDPQTPYYDVIVCERYAGSPPSATPRAPAPASSGSEPAARARSPADRAATGGTIDFCHTVAGVVFEAIAASSHVGLERAVMDTYLDVAETIAHPDELCLRLLESIALEVDTRLEPEEQATLLAMAAANLPRCPDDRRASEPLERSLAALETVGLLDGYRVEPFAENRLPGTRSWTAELGGYALDGTPGRMVTLPIVVELFGRLSMRSVTITDVEAIDRSPPVTWRLRIATGTTTRPSGLVCVRTGGHA